MSPSSPDPGSDPEPGLNTQTHGSSPLPQGPQEASDPTKLQQDQEWDNVSMDASQHMSATQSEFPQEESERQKLMERLHIKPRIVLKRITPAPGTFKGAEKRKTYTSFGDNGTTASVSAYGHLLQISRYFGIGHSGFFCADLPDFPSPNYSNSRLREILGKAQSNATTIGINWKKVFADSWDFDETLPCLEFVDDRWPRFVSPAPDKCDDETTRNNQDQAQTEDKTTSRGPHHSSTLSKNFFFSVQYFCNEGAIFQKYTLERRADAQADLHLKQLELQANLLIRNLDFTKSSGFNVEDRNFEDYRQLERSEESERQDGSEESRAPIYSYRLGVNKRSLEVVHRITQESSEEMGLKEPEHKKAVVLTITPYVNGALQPLSLEGEAATINLSQSVQLEVQRFGVLDVVLAYKLQLEDKTYNKPVDFERIISKSPMSGHESYEQIDFSSHPQLDFIIRRNLEHILSVCSIPVQASTPAHFEEENATSTDDSNSPIALTCGDISGHFIGLEASFYALQFLREMQRYLWDKRSPYANTLRERIQTTCDRHLKWVFESTEISEETDQPDQSFSFSPHYWASGRKICEVPWLRGPSRVDTPLQILKIFDLNISSAESRFRAYMDSRGLSKKSRKTLSKRVAAWLQGLEKDDERKRYAFARISSTEKTKFHLVDHVRISQVLTKLEVLNEYGVIEITESLKRFNPEVVEKNILKRFITENPISKQRTIATSRTESETRFLFHSKDTALFHAMDFGVFFKEQSRSDEEYDGWRFVMDEWKNTIDCQVEHEETRELKWRKPLWYALSFIIASKERSINSTSPAVLLNTTGRILFGMASASGLSPGYLTNAQAPMEFAEETDRDNYWQTTFEILYILWKYGKDKVAKLASVDSSQPSGMDEKDEAISSLKKGRLMTKKMQFANSRGLVEISDDLIQQGPEALKFGSDPGFLRSQDSDDGWNPVIKLVYGFSSSSGEVTSAGWRTYCLEIEGKKCANSFTDEMGNKGLVVDIPRGQQRSKGTGLMKTLYDNRALARHLGRPRDVQLAKKRLIWLPKADNETALVCCLASPPDEQYELSAFFDRHALYDKYFSDDTSATLNEWKTELQLSFYRLAVFANLNDFHGEEGIPKFSYVIPDSIDTQRGAINPKRKPITGIVRAAMGFRFVGDFFDRYWTCHFLEYIPGIPPTKARPNENTISERFKDVEPRSAGNPEIDFAAASSSTESISQGCAGHSKTLGESLSGLKKIPDQLKDPRTSEKKYPWQQRRVLELLLFDQILTHMEKETKDIFNWARANMLNATKSTDWGGSLYSEVEAQKCVLGLEGFSDNGQPYKMAASDPLNPLSEAINSAYQIVGLGDSEAYFNIIDRWRLFKEILQTLGEDLTENLKRIEEWSRREQDREPESPVWTRNDEKLFRTTIKKLRFQNQRKIQDLERLNSSIQTFRDSLTGRLESIREDMSFRGSENMSLFTYVTVVFLPLGFATGIFSMSEPPAKLTLTFMVVTAITSLSITVFALANAKFLGKSIVEPVIDFVQSFGNPLISILIVPCLFLVYSVEAILRPVYHPIYIHAVKPTLIFFGKQEYLRRYKLNLRPIRELDWITEVDGWFQKEKKKKEKKRKKKASDPEG